RVASKPLVEHWSGRAWSRVIVPQKALAGFSRSPAGWPRTAPQPLIGASSSHNVWIFNSPNGRWLHWNGDQWSHGKLPLQSHSADTEITSELVLARDDVWALGGSVNRSQKTNSYPYAAKFNGRKW